MIRYLGNSRPPQDRSILAFANQPALIDGHVAENLGRSAEPADFDAIHAIARPQAETQTRSEMTLVTASAVDLFDLGKITGDDRHLSSHRVPVSVQAAQFKLQPMVARAAVVAQHCRLLRGNSR